MNSTKTIAIEHLSYRQSKTYVMAMLFIVGNILLPQLCHLVPGGGLRWLPIYFFTLVAAYRYGLVTGLVTAICSPLVNNLLFGMPPTPMLTIILIKSTLLALSASLIASKTGRVTLWTVMLAVIAYQLLGSVAEWALTGSLSAALQDLRIGWPGILMQIVLGYKVLRS